MSTNLDAEMENEKDSGMKARENLSGEKYLAVSEGKHKPKSMTEISFRRVRLQGIPDLVFPGVSWMLLPDNYVITRSRDRNWDFLFLISLPPHIRLVPSGLNSTLSLENRFPKEQSDEVISDEPYPASRSK
ncbi:hypothetical protein RRG08_041047 [Elysia crispata]|uniref:Uncharacterized protein n=1 Tax=Elysia crispata TaxID=231223 RepID=A0AAE0Y7L8_9GAST|nr:hypothetical protein RRG08_041047 [Elysia crispata]